MATHDYNLANQSGASFRSDLNDALQAVLTNNSSASAPSTTAAYMFWADTNTGILKIRNSANDAWVELLQLDGTLTLEDGSASAVALGFRDELNTGIFSSGASNFDVSIAGTTRLNISATGLNVTGTVTDDGATHDGDVTFTGASANVVFDKSDNALEFADNAKATFGASADLSISHDGSNTYLTNSTGFLHFRSDSGINLQDAGGNENFLKCVDNGAVELYHDGTKMFETKSGGVIIGDGGGFDMNINGTRHQFSIGGAEKMRITSDGALGIGTTSPDGRLHLVTGSTTDDAHVTFHASATSGTNNSGEVLKVISARGTGNTNPVFNVLTNSSTSVLSAHGNGNVGIGTTSPRALLDLGGGSGDGTISSTVSEYQLVCEAPQGTGDIGRNIAFAVTTNGISAAINSVDEGGSNATGIAFATGTAGSIAERMRIESDGDLLVSTTTGTLDIGGDSGAVISGSSGTHFFTRGNASSGGAVFWIKGGSGQAYVLGDGDLVNTNGNYDGISDQNLKENIVDANSQWDDIKALKVRNYNFKESTKYSTHKQIGVIAQELEASGMNGLVKDIEDTLYIEGDELPEGKNIGDVKEEGYKAVSYSVLYMKAIKALQEAMTKIETLETKVAALEAG